MSMWQSAARLLHVLDVMKVVEDAVDRDVDVIDLDLHMSADRFRQKGMKIYGMKRDTPC